MEIFSVNCMNYIKKTKLAVAVLGLQLRQKTWRTPKDIDEYLIIFEIEDSSEISIHELASHTSYPNPSPHPSPRPPKAGNALVMPLVLRVPGRR